MYADATKEYQEEMVQKMGTCAKMEEEFRSVKSHEESTESASGKQWWSKRFRLRGGVYRDVMVSEGGNWEGIGEWMEVAVRHGIRVMKRRVRWGRGFYSTAYLREGSNCCLKGINWRSTVEGLSITRRYVKKRYEGGWEGVYMVSSELV